MWLFRERLLSRLVDKHAISQELAERAEIAPPSSRERTRSKGSRPRGAAVVRAGRAYRVGIKEILDLC